MIKLIGLRLFAALATLAVLSAVIFSATEILPGDVADLQLGQYATKESTEQLRKELGITGTPIERYGRWLNGIAHGDFGKSMTTRGPLADLLEERLKNTATLAGFTALIAVPIAVLLGISMALYAGTLFERITSAVVMAFAAVPEFLVATVAVAVFAVSLKWLPAVSYVTPGLSLKALAVALVLPILTLVLHITAQIARMTKSTIANILTQPFIEMADLKGLSAWRKIAFHVGPNMAGPLANVIALNVAYLVSGVVVVETVFAYPGLARLMIDAVNGRDMPVIQACAMIFSAVYILLIFIADLSAASANPRLRKTVRA